MANTNIEVKVINVSKTLPLPAYATIGSAGMDLYACFDGETHIDKTICIHPGEIVVIPTNLKIELPSNWEATVNSRSGLAAKFGIYVLNSPGLIDEDYRGVIGVILYNCSKNIFEVNHGDKIAQLKIAPVNRITWVPVEALSSTKRGSGGFGSTDK